MASSKYGGYHNNNVTGDFEYERKQIVNVARDLCYDKSVIAKLETAETSFELDRIMKEARNACIINELTRGKRKCAKVC